MSRGLLDLVSWPVEFIDSALGFAHVPPVARVLLWGALAGMAGMWLYRRFSPQQRLTDLRVELARAQTALNEHDGDFASLWILIKNQLRLAFAQLGHSVVPAILAGVPSLLLLPWLSNQFDATWPTAGTPVKVCAIPSAAAALMHWDTTDTLSSTDGCWTVSWPRGSSTVRLLEGGSERLRIPPAALSPIIHKEKPLNLLVGNPAGYLDPRSALDAITLELPAAGLVEVGPGWLRNWLVWFFTAVLLVSIWLRRRWRLH